AFNVRMTSKPSKRGRSRSMRITWGFDRSHELLPLRRRPFRPLHSRLYPFLKSLLMSFRYPWSSSAIRSLTASRLSGVHPSGAASCGAARTRDHERPSGSAPLWTTHTTYGPVGMIFLAGAAFGTLSSSTPSLSVPATYPMGLMELQNKEAP